MYNAASVHKPMLLSAAASGISATGQPPIAATAAAATCDVYTEPAAEVPVSKATTASALPGVKAIILSCCCMHFCMI
jgi:hypothetical protein